MAPRRGGYHCVRRHVGVVGGWGGAIKAVWSKSVGIAGRGITLTMMVVGGVRSLMFIEQTPVFWSLPHFLQPAGKGKGPYETDDDDDRCEHANGDCCERVIVNCCYAFYPLIFDT